MLPATSPEMLDRKVRELIETQGLQGFLLSGGSNRRNEIRYERFYPVVERLKRDHPGLRIAIHTALTDLAGARAMEAAGVDTAMMDVIGADETIREVYHLDRPVADFEATLAALCTTSMEVTPHIVIGLHYGRILGEAAALDIVSRHRGEQPGTGGRDAVLRASPAASSCPTPATSGGFLPRRARALRAATSCWAVPGRPGMHKRVTDTYAVLAGLDGIAFPADGAVAVARAIGRPFEQQHACCSIKLGGRGTAGADRARATRRCGE